MRLRRAIRGGRFVRAVLAVPFSIPGSCTGNFWPGTDATNGPNVNSVADCLTVLPPEARCGMTERALSVYRKALALSVHILTATGAVAGLVALMRITEGDYRSAFLYLFLAMGIDMVDGTLARSANVKKVMPGFDGALLDNIVDYLNYTLVPAFFLVKSGIAGSPMSFILAALILLSSAYQFCQLDAKTEDHFFKGFPSYWNILIFYFFLLQPEPATVIFLVLLCVALVFVPVLYLYPSRMIRFKKLTVILTSLYTLLLLHQVAMAPDHSVTVVYASLLYVVYYVVLSLFFTWEKRSRV